MIQQLFVRSLCKPPEYTGALKNNRCTKSSELYCSSHYPGTGTVPKKQKSEWEMRAKTAREIFNIFTYTGGKNKQTKNKTPPPTTKKTYTPQERKNHKMLHEMLTLFLQRSWQLGRRGHLCWNSRTFLELADHLSGKRCWVHSGPNSS